MPVAKKSDKIKLIIKALHLAKDVDNLFLSPIITEFRDTWTPRWTATNVYGRNDPIAFYNGTGRELTLGFRIVSDSSAEALENMKKISKLIQWQYGTYTQTFGSKRSGAKNTGVYRLQSPPYFGFQFGNVVAGNIVGANKHLQGYINGPVQINPGFQSKAQAQYWTPQGQKKLFFSDVNIVLRIQVLHEKPMGFRTELEGDSPNTQTGESDYEDRQESYPYGVAAFRGNKHANRARKAKSPVPKLTPTQMTDATVRPLTLTELNVEKKRAVHGNNMVRLGIENNEKDMLS